MSTLTPTPLTTRLAAHQARAAAALRDYGPLRSQDPHAPRLHLVPFCVSVWGSFGPPALRFLAECGRRAGAGLPPALLGEATWAAPRFAPYARMAICLAVRRGLADSILALWRCRPTHDEHDELSTQHDEHEEHDEHAYVPGSPAGSDLSGPG